MNLPLALKAGTIGAGVQFLLCLAAWIVNPGFGPAVSAGAASRAVALLPAAAAAALVFLFLTLSKGLPLPPLSARQKKLARLAIWCAAFATATSPFLWRRLPLPVVLGVSLTGFVLGPLLLALSRAPSEDAGRQPQRLPLAAAIACGLLSLQGTLTFCWMATLSTGALFAATKVSPQTLLYSIGLEIAPTAAFVLATASCGTLFMLIQDAYAARQAEPRAAERS